MDVLSDLARRHKRIIATNSKSAVTEMSKEGGSRLGVGEEQEEECDEVGHGLHLELCRVHDVVAA